MKDASRDLIKAARAALLADAYIATQCGDRVFSSWDYQEVPTPLIRMQTPMTLPWECDGGGEGSETSINFHIFTVENAPAVARMLASKIRDVLHNARLTLDDSDLVSIDYRDTREMKDDQSPKLQTLIVRFVALTTSK